MKNSYGQGRNEYGEPRFHFTDKVKGSSNKLSILIPDENIWNESKELYINSDDSTQNNWCGLRKEKRLLIEWLNKPNTKLLVITNIQAIIYSWDTLNADNKNVRKIKE
ncbi:MAG: hypothetical protein AB7S48_06525 [Bacteroidales bacterium]